MNTIYYICIDHDVYEDREYVRTDSWEEGFWVSKPTDKEVEDYLLCKYPHLQGYIKEKRMGYTSIVWDIEKWERINDGK